MERSDFAAVTEREADALVAAAASDLDARCPTCPEWTTADLLRHVGVIYRRFAASIQGRLTERPPAAEAPPDARLADWVADGAATVVGLLRTADERPEVWTWAGQRPVSWVARRLAHETAVHRWDAQASVGASAPIEPALAADCADEFLGVYLPTFAPRYAGPPATLRLRATDVAGEWLMSVADDPPSLAGDGDADATVAGGASDLALALWGRVEPATLEVTGDERLAAGWFDWLARVRR